MTLGPFDTADQLHNACIQILQKAGYRVIGRPADEGPWITCGEIRKYLRVGHPALSDALRHADCPPFTAERSPTGRILRLRANPAFSAWLLTHLSNCKTYQPTP